MFFFFGADFLVDFFAAELAVEDFVELADLPAEADLPDEPEPEPESADLAAFVEEPDGATALSYSDLKSLNIFLERLI